MANPPATTAHAPVSSPAQRTEWRSPPPETPLTVSTPLPKVASIPEDVMSPPPSGPNDLLHPSFLPVCDHSDGDSHAHAFDLLSLAAQKPSGSSASGNAPPHASPPQATIASSVPARSSYLSASRPPVLHHPSSNGAGAAVKGDASGSNPKPRRMSSSTTGVLGRGKLGLTGETPSSLSKEPRPLLVNHATSYSGTSPIPNRRPTLPGTSPTPQLFDFAKTDRRPSHSTGQRPPVFASRSTSSVIPASMPVRSHMHAAGQRSHPPPPPPQLADDMELDMAFDGGDEEDPSEGERSGSAERDDMDMDGMEEEGKVSALGQGSGGVKGRRKGMVFKCETCSKEYRHPSCLVKHRWEHSPHWKETAQLSMSKHQQVQMLEAAAILAHLDPGQGRALPTDKSLWPSVLSPPGGESFLRRPSRDLTGMRSTPSSSGLPLTPGSLRDPASFGAGKERKSSPDTDSTTSSMGAGEPYVPASSVKPVAGMAPKPGQQHRNSFASNNGGYPGSPQSGGMPSLHPRVGSFSSSVPSTVTAHSVGSLPNQMASLRFGSTPTGSSPITRPGMFGLINTARPNSSVRSGADDPIEDDEDDWNARRGGAHDGPNKAQRGFVRGGKKASEEAEEYSMAMDMEL